MPLSTPDILRLVGEVLEEEKIKIAITESLKGGVVAGASTIVGGVLLGPIGLAIGGIFGGVSSYFVSQGKFESVPVVLMKLEPSKKEQLANKVRVILNDIDASDVIAISVYMLAPEMKARLLQETINFLSNQMNMKVIC